MSEGRIDTSGCLAHPRGDVMPKPPMGISQRLGLGGGLEIGGGAELGRAGAGAFRDEP